MKFHLTDLYSLGRGKRTDCDLDDNVEDSGTNDGTSANISLNVPTQHLGKQSNIFSFFWDNS